MPYIRHQYSCSRWQLKENDNTYLILTIARAFSGAANSPLYLLDQNSDGAVNKDITDNIKP